MINSILKDEYNYKQLTIIWIVLIGFLNIIYNASFPLHYDEVYYWWMSKNLALSYFDIPTMLPLLINIATTFGDEAWQIRLVNIFCISVSSWFLFLLLKDIYNQKVAFLTIFTTLLLPYAQAGYSVTTTDMPFLLFWVLGVYFAYQVIFYGKAKDFIFLGIILGLGFISKYSMALLGGGLFLYAIFYRRDLFVNKYTLLTIGFFILCSLPLLIWNYQHDWMSITFRYEYGSTDSYEISQRGISEYGGGLLTLFTPVFFFFFLWQLFTKVEKSTKEKFLLFIGLFFLIFFFYKALFKPMALNWLSPGVHIVFGFIISRIILGEFKKLYIVGMLIAVMLSMVIKFPDLLNIPPKANIKSKVMGYKEAIDYLQPRIPEGSIVATTYYSSASMFEYYTRDLDYTVIELFSKRISDIDFWYDYSQFKNKDIYVIDTKENNVHVKKDCTRLEYLDKFIYDDPRYSEKRKFYLFKCYGVKIDESN